jgi:hypothetical protein
MESPFPGMDPYLEQHWRSVHHRLITYAGDQLQSALPHRFRVEVEERVFVVGEPDGERLVAPDVYVVERPRPKRPNGSAADRTTIAEPVVIDLPHEPITETYLEIIDTASGNKVITALEFLSPTNKIIGDGNEMYVRKQREYRVAGVSQVEVDLTRRGDRSLVFPMNHIPRPHRTLYLACVRRGGQPSKIEAYPMPLQSPLPTIGVPLDAAADDVPLNLAALVNQCYRNGRYEDIDYRRAPFPPLPEEDAVWADDRLRGKGLR